MTNQSLPVVLIIDDSPIDIAFLVETLSSTMPLLLPMMAIWVLNQPASAILMPF